MNAEDRLLDNGYQGIKYLTDFSYDTALIGVTADDRAVYDYELMVQWLMENQDMSEEDAADWISYNTIRALPYFGEDGPIILFPLDDTSITVCKPMQEVDEC